MTIKEAVVAIVVAIIGSTGLWTLFTSWLQNRKKKKSNTSKLLMGISYTMIVQRAETYIARGWVSTDEYHELHHYLYTPYEAEGGNGTAKRLMDMVGELPNVPLETSK